MAKDRIGLVARLQKETAAQSLIETALVVSLFALLLVGTAELGRVAYAAIEVSNAARAGAAYGAQNGSTAADSTGIATAAANDAANLSGVITTSSYSCICSNGTSSTCTPGDCSTSHIEETVTVNSQVSFDPLIHLPGLPTTYTLKGKAVQKCLQ
jgi:Flp pilus assembly protein TadG